MPEQQSRPDRSGVAGLAVGAAEAARAVAGVVRLEPTLRGQLRRWSGDSATMIRSGGPTELPDGVVVHERDGVVEVRVDIAVRPVRPADVIADEVRAAVVRVITDAGRAAGTVTVSVLAVEPG